MAKQELEKEDLIQLALLLVLFLAIFALGLHWWKFTRNAGDEEVAVSERIEAPQPVRKKVAPPTSKEPSVKRTEKKKAEPKVEPKYVQLKQRKKGDDYWLEVKTNASSHFPVRLEFVGERGSVLGYPSYRLVKTLRKKADFKFNASKMGIPPGRYKITAKVGKLTDGESLRLGTGDSNYRRKLKNYKKQVSFKHMEEKREFIRLLRHVKKLSDNATRGVRSGSIRSSRQLGAALWVKDKRYQRINWRNRNSYFFAAEYYNLKSIINTAKAGAVQKQTMTRLRNNLARLEERAQLASFW